MWRQKTPPESDVRVFTPLPQLHVGLIKMKLKPRQEINLDNLKE
jgi:hypothetical protein